MTIYQITTLFTTHYKENYNQPWTT